MDYIYLDNNATTRIDPDVLNAMMPYLSEQYGNASSGHWFGRQANDAIKKARTQVARLINCEPDEIVFTSGATESINLAIKGIAESYAHKGRHIITVQTEHAAVLDVCQFLQLRGYELTYLPVSPDGLIDLHHLAAALRPDTILVSVMAVNNETGVQQPIRQIAELAHSVGALFMSDATQAVGKTPLSVNDDTIDLLAFSAHKFHGPKGIGGLFVRRSPGPVKIEAATHGGGHERGLRSGTLNVPGIVGMGMACEKARTCMAHDSVRIRALRDQLETALLDIEGAFVNGGSRENRLYNVTNISFPHTDANTLIGQLNNLAVSNGSACSSAVFEPSHVLTAMGLTDDEASGAIRFSLGRYTTVQDIQGATEIVKNNVYAARY